MKACPLCQRTFDDSLSFCLEDGSLLSAPLNAESENNDTEQITLVRANVGEYTTEQETILRPDLAPPYTPSATTRSIKPFVYAGAIVGAILIIVVGYFGFSRAQQLLTGGGSPTVALMAGSEAIKSKDIEGVKKFFNFVQLAVWAESAKAKGLSLDEYLKNELDSGGWDSLIIEEVFSEKISGDRATLEVRTRSGRLTIIMDRMNGVWQYFG